MNFLDEGTIQFWGFQPPWFSKFKTLCQQKKGIISIFGDPDSMMGLIDDQHNLSFVKVTSEHVDCILNVEQAVYCQGKQDIFVLKQQSGQVEQYSIHDLKCEILDLPCQVTKMSASNTHILFLTNSTDAPVYGLGSNRLSQLGIDYQQQELKSPSMIEYFCGLRDASDVACGPFHSAIILGGDVYTFGWSKDGRLGWGASEDKDDIISLAVFLDINDQPIEIDAKKVVCGSAHTLVLDGKLIAHKSRAHMDLIIFIIDQGHVWSCGSNTYGQLGRTIAENQSDAYFRRCTIDKAIDCFTGRWTSFILL